MSKHHAHEHEYEPVAGLPAPLPAGERMLWQGGPDWRLVARDVAHVRKVAFYFVLLAAWRVASGLADGLAAADIAVNTAWTLVPAACAIGLILLLSWLMARTTIYTITDRRVVMRIGVVLRISFNLPYRAVVGARLRPGRAGSGDIALALDPDSKIAWLHLWPHSRPWRFVQPEPTLRALPDAGAVAKLLVDALAAATSATSATSAAEAVRAAAGSTAVGASTGSSMGSTAAVGGAARHRIGARAAA